MSFLCKKVVVFIQDFSNLSTKSVNNLSINMNNTKK